MTVMLVATSVFASAVQAAPTKTKQTVSSTTPVAIPDWAEPVHGSPGVVYVPVEVAGVVGTITKVTASMHIDHESTSDLNAAVIGPDASAFAYLFDITATSGSGLGTSCADADRTTFDDAAPTAIDAGSSPYVGSYRPTEAQDVPLSVFNGNAGGTNGTWTLTVVDEKAGTTGTVECWSLFIETDAGQSLRFDSTEAVAVPDGVDATGGPGVADSSVTMTDLSGGVAYVTVSAWISHPRVSDLDVILVSPSGQEVKLAARVGGAGSDFGTSCSKATTFDGTVKASIATGVAPFVGSFRPMESLATLNGEAPNGEWTLRAVDHAENNVGQVNCWSLTVVASTATSPSGVIVRPRLPAPEPLPGTVDQVYTGIRNTAPTALEDVVLTGVIPKEVSDVRPDLSFPNCTIGTATYTCTWPSIPPGATVFGGVIAKVGNPKNGKFCLTSTVTATGIKPVTGTNCINVGSYPAGDRGTGYAVGDVAHDLVLRDQHGELVALSDYAGKYVLLQFTARWCAPSMFEVPQDRDEIAALNDSNAMGVEVVYLSVLIDGLDPGVASTREDAESWATEYDLTWPVLTTADDVLLRAQQHHQSYSLENGPSGAAYPTSIFIRPNGEVFDLRVGVEEFGGTTDRFLSDLQ